MAYFVILRHSVTILVTDFTNLKKVSFNLVSTLSKVRSFKLFLELAKELVTSNLKLNNTLTDLIYSKLWKQTLKNLQDRRVYILLTRFIFSLLTKLEHYYQVEYYIILLRLHL